MSSTLRGRVPIGVFLLVLGLVSVWASITLATEGFWLLKDGVQPSCNINPFFSCGNVMQSPEAHAFFAVPNYFWGISGWSVVAATGAGLLGNVTFPRWWWRVYTVGMIAAWAFLMWLFTQAVYEIGYLCLYCMLTWTTQTFMMWVSVAWGAREKLCHDSERLSRIGERILPYAWLIAVINLGGIVLAILAQFPTLLPMLLRGS